MSRPRIRTIKPEMFADEAFGTLSPHARLLFIGLITMADDDGRLRALPAAIIGHVFPYDDVPVRKLDRWLEEIVAAGLAVRYEVAGLPYAVLPGWPKHQRVNRPTPSNLPEPPPNTPCKLTEDSVNDHDDLTDRSLSHARGRAPIRSDQQGEPSETLAAGARENGEVAELDNARNRRNARRVTYQGKQVPDATVIGAELLLATFNRATERTLGPWTASGKPSPVLRQIIGAMIARPDVTVEQWEAGVRRTVAQPPSWLTGPVQIGHVFGERAAEWALTANDAPAGDEGDRLIAQALGKAS